MALNNAAVFLPGRGTVFVADPGTPVPNYKTVDPGDPSTYEGWDCLGHTSRDNTVALTKDGGDTTQLGSWWNEALRTSKEAETWGGTANSLQIDRTTLQLAFPSGSVKTDSNGNAYYDFGGSATIEKAVFVLMVDGTGRMAINQPRVDVSIGDAPEIATDGFFEIQLAWTALQEDATGSRIQWYHPALDAPVAAWEATTAYALNDRVTLTGGAVLQATTAGTSGTTAPTPPAVGATVTDGTVTWTRQS